MPKWDAIGFGADNAEVEPSETFVGYDGPVPPRGIYRFNAKRLKVGEVNSGDNAGDPKVSMVLEIAEPAGTQKAKFNGYAIWLHRNVSKENVSRTNQMLLALLAGTKLTEAKQKAVLKAWHTGNVVYDESTGLISKIGTWNIPEDGIPVAGNTRPDKYDGEDRLQIGGLIPITQAPEPVPADDEDEEYAEDESDEYEEEDEEELEDEEEPEDEDEEESEEEDPADARAEELEGMNRTALKKLIKELDPSFKVTTKVTDDEIIEAILAVEFPEDEAEEEDEADEEEPEEDEEEPEPEPVKPARRAPSGRAKATPAASTRPAARRRGGKKGADDEPPF